MRTSLPLAIRGVDWCVTPVRVKILGSFIALRVVGENLEKSYGATGQRILSK